MMTDELKLNPLGDRVTKVFSSRADGLMTFDDYLDMYSALVSNEQLSMPVTMNLHVVF